MREIIWNRTRAGLTECMILPWWALIVKAMLYPGDFMFWRTKGQRYGNWQKPALKSFVGGSEAKGNGK